MKIVYNDFMARLLPFVFLISTTSLFGLAWIITSFDPEVAPWYIFTLFIILLFLSIFGLLGLILYFIRTRLYKRYNVSWYVYTSFKMAFFVALFIAGAAALTILDSVSLTNTALLAIAISLFALWSFLGKKR